MADRIEYDGKVYVYSSGMPAGHIQLAKERLGEYGVNENDIEVIEVPEGVPEGCVIGDTLAPLFVGGKSQASARGFNICTSAV
jgi:UDP-glucose 6-dehydrogenase